MAESNVNGLAILMAKLAMRMRGVTGPGGRGSSETIYLDSLISDPNLLFIV